jgi:hypothetical protein
VEQALDLLSEQPFLSELIRRDSSVLAKLAAKLRDSPDSRSAGYSKPDPSPDFVTHSPIQSLSELNTG